MTTFERKRARVMVSMFLSGWGLMIVGWCGVTFGHAFGWWNVIPFSVGALLLFLSGPYVNGRLWGWAWRSYFGGSKE